MLAAVYGLNLTKLNIFSCGSVTQPGLMRILISNPNLGSINLACCRRVFSGLPDGTVTIFNEMKVNEINLSQLSIPYFRSIGTLKGLKSLEINGLDSPGSEILKGLEGLETTSLSTLKARFLGVPVQERKNTEFERITNNAHFFIIIRFSWILPSSIYHLFYVSY